MSFCRECRVTVEVLGETIAAIKLAGADTWDQLWTDVTTRRQIPFTVLTIGLLGEADSDTIDLVIISPCIFMIDETSETQVEGILERVRPLICCAVVYIIN